MSTQGKWIVGIVSIVVVFALLACGIFLAWGYLFGGKPSVAITAPPSNYQAEEGEEVIVEARATGRSIERIELWVDDGLMDSASSPSPQDTFSAALTWEATGLGRHTVEVRAYDARGQVSELAAIVLMVATGVAEVTPTVTVEVPPETPTPTATSSPEATATSTTSPPPTATPTLAPPVMDSFTLDDTTITAGETTYLRWEFHNATESHLYRDDVEIDSGLASSGNRPVNPVVTRTFKLVVSNAAGSAEASVTLTVTPAVVADPVIHYFKVNDIEGDITITGGESVTLKWDTDNAWGGVSLNGTGVVSPAETTETPGVGAHTYTLVADNGAGVQVSLSRTVTVYPAGSETMVLLPVASLSGDLSSAGCSGLPVRAGIAPAGNGIRGVASFEISGLALINATLDLSHYTLTGDPFEFLHPLHVEQVEYLDRCAYPGTYSGSALASLAQLAAAVPGLENSIDVTAALADYLASGSPDYFQIRLRFDADDAGSAFASMVEWSTVQLTVVHQP